jgi:hypothetical protein
METHLVIALLVSWTTVFVALSKGIQSLGKVKIKKWILFKNHRRTFKET